MKCPHCNSEMVVWYLDLQDHLFMPIRDVPHWYCRKCAKWICRWHPGDSEEETE